jgi:hypothetical protein
LPFLSVNVKSIPELVRLGGLFPRAKITSTAVWFAVAWLPLGRARSGIRLVYVTSLQPRGVTGVLVIDRRESQDATIGIRLRTLQPG